MPAGSPAWPPPPTATPHVEGVMARARADDPQALESLFRQFIPPEEEIVETRYMGVMGLWGIGTHSFGAVTTQRVATLRVGLLKELTYQDGSLEYVNSSAVYQPSLLRLWALPALWVVLVGGMSLVSGSAGIAVLGLFLALVLVPVVLKLSYRLNKSGLVVWVREGLHIYMFVDRTRNAYATRFYRLCSGLRDERIRDVGHP